MTLLRFRDPFRLLSSFHALFDLHVAYLYNLYIFLLAWPREGQANVARLSLLFSLARLRLKRLAPVVFSFRAFLGLRDPGLPFSFPLF